jgi:hypothetical protein
VKRGAGGGYDERADDLLHGGFGPHDGGHMVVGALQPGLFWVGEFYLGDILVGTGQWEG